MERELFEHSDHKENPPVTVDESKRVDDSKHVDESHSYEPNYHQIQIELSLDQIEIYRKTQASIANDFANGPVDIKTMCAYALEYNAINHECREHVKLMRAVMTWEGVISNEHKRRVSEYDDVVFNDIDDFGIIVEATDRILRRVQALWYAAVIYAAHLHHDDPTQQHDFEDLQHEYDEIRNPANEVPQANQITQDDIDRIVVIYNDLIPQATNLLRAIAHRAIHSRLSDYNMSLANDYALENPQAIDINDYRLDLPGGPRAVYEFYVEFRQPQDAEDVPFGDRLAVMDQSVSWKGG